MVQPYDEVVAHLRQLLAAAKEGSASTSLARRLAAPIPTEMYGLPFETLRRGVDCPHCQRFLKVNRKRLNHTMMQYLFHLYSARTIGDGWVQASRVRIQASVDPTTEIDQESTVQTGDYRILTLWGLAELHPERSGFARIAPLGVAFVQGRATVRESVLIENYKNQFVAFDGPEVTAQQANATPFELSDL